MKDERVHFYLVVETDGYQGLTLQETYSSERMKNDNK